MKVSAQAVIAAIKRLRECESQGFTKEAAEIRALLKEANQ